MTILLPLLLLALVGCGESQDTRRYQHFPPDVWHVKESHLFSMRDRISRLAADSANHTLYFYWPDTVRMNRLIADSARCAENYCDRPWWVIAPCGDTLWGHGCVIDSMGAGMNPDSSYEAARQRLIHGIEWYDRIGKRLSRFIEDSTKEQSK